MKKTKILSVSDAAKTLGCTTKYVYDLLQSGLLEASKIDRKWQIAETSVQAHKAKRGAR